METTQTTEWKVTKLGGRWHQAAGSQGTLGQSLNFCGLFPGL